MDQANVARLERYVEMYEEIKSKVGDDRVALALLQESAKDRRMQEMREERELRNGEHATTRQLAFLKRLGVKATPGLTKKQASVLIDEAREAFEKDALREVSDNN